MSWGHSSPNLKIHERLSYGHIAELLERHRHKKTGEYNIYNGNSDNYALRSRGYTNPATHQYETAMCVRLYSTDILQYFADGTVVVNDYDSSVTRYMLDRLGPITVFKSPTCRWYDKQRWRPRGSGVDYPMRKAIVIPPDGIVVGMVDRGGRIKAEAKKERAFLSKKFRERALTRLALGEFPGAIVRVTNGWQARVPCLTENKKMLFTLLSEEMDHQSIAQFYSAAHKQETISHVVFGRDRGARF